jgi:hypothetical protein
MSAENFYTRMFPQMARPPSNPGSKLEIGLAELGKRMKRRKSVDARVFAGFTYVGQFVDHDLTFDITPLARAHPHAELIQNFRSAFLDLDHLYGGGPSIAPYLFERTDRPGTERFLIGKTEDGKPKDLPRNPAGIAIVADPRQDENLIIAQLHVFFLEFHNQLVSALITKKLRSLGPAGGTVFDQARRLLTWWYQQFALSIVGALLDQIIVKEVRERYTSGRSRGSKQFRIPIEFAVAAFRFGHSMVRDSYDYNEFHAEPRNPATLRDLLDRTGMGGGIKGRLAGDWIIDLRRFLSFGSGPSNHANVIGPHVAAELFQLHPNTVKVFNAPIPANEIRVKQREEDGEDFESMLPVRNLWRGARMGLPSGQDIAKALSLPMLGSDEIADCEDADLLTNPAFRFDRDTPLWYYVLREAELRGGGAHLGPVGSYIVAETLFAALWSDPNSYVSVYPEVKPLKGFFTDTAEAFIPTVFPA